MANDIIPPRAAVKRPAVSDPEEAIAKPESDDEIEDVDLDKIQALEVSYDLLHSYMSRSLHVFQSFLQDELRSLRAKKVKADTRAAKRVKMEPISHKGLFVPGEIIDLT